MRTRREFLGAFAVFGCAAGVGFAAVPQGSGNLRGMLGAARPFGMRGRLRLWLRDLALTPEQTAAAKAAFLRLQVEQRALGLEELPPEEYRQRLFALRRDFFARLQEILSAEQQEKLERRIAASRPRWEEALRRRASDLAAKLELTPEQRERARETLAAARERAEQLRTDPALDDPTRFATLLGLMEQTQRDLYRLLTPEQRRRAVDLLVAAMSRRFAGA